MTIKEMESHGAKFSKSFANSDSIWKKDPIGMGNKTVIKLLLSKFAPLSIEMQTAIKTDQAVINNPEGTDLTYTDHEEIPINKEVERLQLMIDDAKSVDALMELEPHVKELNDPETTEQYHQKTLNF